MRPLYAALFALGALSLAACDGGDGPIEEAAEEIDNIVEPRAGDGSDAADAVEDAANDAGDAIEDIANDVEDAIDTPQ